VIASHPLLVEEELGDLYRVEGGALEQLVAWGDMGRYNREM